MFGMLKVLLYDMIVGGESERRRDVGSFGSRNLFYSQLFKFHTYLLKGDDIFSR